MSARELNKIFQKICRFPPLDLRRILQDHTGENSITPHDLRHTCAVVRLNQLLSSGMR